MLFRSFRLMKAAEHNPKFAKKVGIKPAVAAEYTESNVGQKSYKDLPTHAAKGGLYANIHAKRERIAHGSGEKMRKPGAKGAPAAEAFKQSAKGVVKHSKGDAERAKASLRRWKCSGW